LPVPSLDELRSLVGHEFPGGTYTIAHWENYLLTECTGAEPLADGRAHPVALFHMPIIGAGTSIAEMFALGRAESDFSIGIESYDWELFTTLREDVRYRIAACITAAERLASDGGRLRDRIQFRFDLSTDTGGPVARATITWLYGRSQT
jgi:hypothetical protein